MEIIIRKLVEEKISFLDIINSPIIISLIGVIFGMISTTILSTYKDKKNSKTIVYEFVIKELYKEYLFIKNRKDNRIKDFLTYDKCQSLSKLIADQLHNILNMNYKSLKKDLLGLLKLTNKFDEENIVKIYEQLEKITNKIT